MLCQIRTLSETFVTALDWASKRLFIGVNSQMVEEVASLSELLVTAWILALHDSPDSSCLNMFVSQDFVICSIRYMFALAH